MRMDGKGKPKMAELGLAFLDVCHADMPTPGFHHGSVIGTYPQTLQSHPLGKVERGESAPVERVDDRHGEVLD